MLTDAQKKSVINYLLAGVGKGFFEDCDEFWEGLTQEQIDDKYPEYRDEVEKFVDGCKETLLSIKVYDG